MHKPGPGRWTFVLETADGGDVLPRILGPFVLAGATLASLALDRGAHGFRIRIEVEALDERRAQTLRQRLQGQPSVHTVAIGWRGEAVAAA